MKKIVLAFALASMVALPSVAQSKINALGHLELAKFQQNRTVRLKTLGTETAAPEVSVIVSFKEGADLISIISDHGWKAGTATAHRIVVTLPIDQVDTLAELPEVLTVSFVQKRRPMMCFARQASTVDAAHSGIEFRGTTNSYTGKGVIVGLMDEGMHANHINFKNSDGSSRVKRLWHFTSTDGTSKDYTDSTIASFTTDNEEETHATHVGGIMGGSYRDEGTYMNITNTTTGDAVETTGPIPFYGVAYESDLAFSVGQLYDSNIITGVENIVNYAKAEGKPAVINLSLGSNSGPHDGSDDFSQLLDELGEQAIVCVAAGNEGERKIAIEQTLTSSSTTVKTIPYYLTAYDGVKSNIGYLDIWASDGQPLTVTVANVTSSGTLSNSVTVSSTANDQRITTCVKSGTLYASAGVDPNNGRYNVLLEFNSVLPKTGRFSINVTGKAGQTINMWFDGYSDLTDSYYNDGTALSGYTAGSSDGTISGMACGSNVISVGAYSTLANFTMLDGYVPDPTGETVGNVVEFSSYGHDFWGNQLPIVVAPGSTTISSYSTPYLEDYGQYEDPTYMVGTVAKDGTNYYWGAMDGTSMATPFVTGTIGLWLEADPTLTVGDIKEILSKTAKSDSYTDKHPERSGFGKIDAEKGLIEVLQRRLAGIDGVVADPEEMTIVNVDGGCIEAYMAGSSHTTMTIYDLQGRCVTRAEGGDRVSATLSAIHGVYVVRIEGTLGTITRKVVL